MHLSEELPLPLIDQRKLTISKKISQASQQTHLCQLKTTNICSELNMFLLSGKSSYLRRSNASRTFPFPFLKTLNSVVWHEVLFNKKCFILHSYVRFGGQLFRQMVGIPMGTNCAPLLPDLFFYSYENEFLDKSLIESSIYHTVILMILSLSIIKDLRSLFLTFTSKNSQFLKPQNLLQLLLISICFSPKIIVTI